MFRQKLSNNGALTAAADFASARTLCWVRADRLDAALAVDPVPSAPGVCNPDWTTQAPEVKKAAESVAAGLPEPPVSSPKPEGGPSRPQSPTAPLPTKLVQAADSLTVSSASSPPPTPPHTAAPPLKPGQAGGSEEGSPASSPPRTASHPVIFKNTARKRTTPPTPPQSAALSKKAVPSLSSGAAGSEQAASTQVHGAAVCPPLHGIKRKGDGSESPSSPCPATQPLPQPPRLGAAHSTAPQPMLQQPRHPGPLSPDALHVPKKPRSHPSQIQQHSRPGQLNLLPTQQHPAQLPLRPTQQLPPPVSHQAGLQPMQPQPAQSHSQPSQQQRLIAALQAGLHAQQPGPSGEGPGRQSLPAWRQPLVRDDTAHEKAMAVLQRYRARKAELKAAGQAKEDMVARKEFGARGEVPDHLYGHVPGLMPGDTFDGKGELSVLGSHAPIGNGIDCKSGHAAYSIVLTGCYADDTDLGGKIEYSGQGGINAKGVQVKDQLWKAGNVCLRENVEAKLPVRVHRRRDKETRVFIYNGLYMVNKACMIDGKSGFKVCSFELEAIEGHAIVSAPVAFNRGTLGRRKLRDADNASSKDAAPKAKVPCIEKRKGILSHDLSGGVENVRIPVINEIDDTRPPDLTYIRRNTFRGPLAQEVHSIAREALLTRGACGLVAARNLGLPEFYTKNGELQSTVPEGVYECPPNCQTSACRHNRVVTTGLKLPLEVFYTGPERGWGVRCSRAIPTGTFITEYVGELIVDTEAEDMKQQGEDTYLFNLDHFMLMHQELECREAGQERETLPKLPYDPAIPKNWYDHPERQAARKANGGQDPDSLEANDPYLVIDARVKGNVGRFMNHSCSPNCVVVSVLTEDSTDGASISPTSSSGLCFRICLFAEQDIPAFTELVYNYSYKPMGRQMACKCGATMCCSVLL